MTYTQSNNLRNHTRICQEMKKLFPSVHCGQECWSKVNLRSHEIRHTGEKPFTCPKCPATFVDRTGLGLHVAALYNKEKYWECGKCKSYSWYSNYELVCHQKTKRCSAEFARRICSLSLRVILTRISV